MKKINRNLALAAASAIIAVTLFPISSQAFDRNAIEKMRKKVLVAPRRDAPADTASVAISNVKFLASAAGAPKSNMKIPSFNPADTIENTTRPKLTTENELDLVKSIDEALNNNRNIKSIQKNVTLADLKIAEASSKYDPIISYQGAFTRLDHENSTQIGPMSVKMSDNVISDNKITYSQTLYTSNRIEYAKLMTQRYKDAAVFSVDSAKVNLVYAVKKGFYDLMLAEQFVKVAGESLELIAEHVKTVKNRFNAGTASKFDLLRVEVQEANTKPNLIKAVHGLTIARNAFNNMLARPIFTDTKIRGKLQKTGLPVVELEEAVKIALSTRRDLKAAEADLAAAEVNVKLAKSQDKPIIALSGNYEKAKGSKTPIDAFDETWNMSLVAQIPIYDASQTKLGTRTANETCEQKKIRYGQLLEDVKLEVKMAHQELIQADELISASEKNVEQAKEALSIARVSYDNGLNTNLEIMDAQLALAQAKTNYYQALHDYSVAFANLEKSMGIARLAE